MATTVLPKINMDNSETRCCPQFDPTGWDGAEIEFHERLFVLAKTLSILHVPLNIGSVFPNTCKKIEAAGALPEDYFLILSTDPSPWRSEHYFAVTKEVPNAEMVKLTGTYLTKVFEGPYQAAGKWASEMESLVASQAKELRKFYAFYTTCPKCAKHYGKNYVIGFAEV